MSKPRNGARLSGFLALVVLVALVGVVGIGAVGAVAMFMPTAAPTSGGVSSVSGPGAGPEPMPAQAEPEAA